ncbi:Borealin-2 [Acipenser ruthenus]|uniref:Borealin-2 n=1 Tax=Acipenser ruthenus TaxID=7906 RepID=A0A444U8Z3_ACIRT|nr:Borealin-2 [Acipenser ruthenus]
MPSKKYRKAKKSEDNTENQTSKEQRDQKIKLFMQHFENEAKERRNYLETKLEKLVSTVDKAFKVELMKMPLDLQHTKLKNLKIATSKIQVSCNPIVCYKTKSYITKDYASYSSHDENCKKNCEPGCQNPERITRIQ